MFSDTSSRCKVSSEANGVIIRHIDRSILQETSANTNFSDLVLSQNVDLGRWKPSKRAIFGCWETLKVLSAAGKHFLMTTKVLGSISRIIALRWHEKYYRKSISKDYRACFYNFSSIKVVVFTLSKWPKALYTIILPQVVLNRASLPTEVRKDVWKFYFLNKYFLSFPTHILWCILNH